jgi:hypothetical protein
VKLSPPASSSDLEAARAIARRLHRRRHEDRSEVDDDAPEPPRPLEPPPAPEPSPAPAPPELPSWDEPVGEAPPAPDAVFDPLAGVGEPSAVEEPQADEGMPDLEVEEPSVSPEELVGAPEAPALEDLPEAEAGPSPFDVELDEAPAEEVVEVATPPSWDDVVVACLGLSQARGAMLVDPAGQVVAARGEWPEPGPDAIAAKLVATMERTLKDAPTRSISAPLMGRHLTAWRVPLPQGLVTAAFIGDSPVRAEARPAIDAEIHNAAGA